MNEYEIFYKKPSYDGKTVYDFSEKKMGKTIAEAIMFWVNDVYRERSDGSIYRTEKNEKWIYKIELVK